MMREKGSAKVITAVAKRLNFVWRALVFGTNMLDVSNGRRILTSTSDLLSRFSLRIDDI